MFTTKNTDWSVTTFFPYSRKFKVQLRVLLHGDCHTVVLFSYLPQSSSDYFKFEFNLDRDSIIRHFELTVGSNVWVNCCMYLRVALSLSSRLTIQR